MASTIRQRLRRFNGTDYDTIHLETETGAISDYVYPCNPNLLDNWYFVGGGSQRGDGQFPINRRGHAPYTSYGYSLDRWFFNAVKVGATVLNIGPNGISVTTSEAVLVDLHQNLELSYDSADPPVVTFSAMIGGIVYWATFSYCAQNTPILLARGDGYDISCLSVPLQNIILRVVTNQSVETPLIAAVKLELGDQQTLAHQDANGNWALNEIPNYQEQLLRCQTSKVDTSDTYTNKTNIVDNYYVRPNLLDNWYFIGGGSQQGGGQLPVNQRGGYVVPPNTYYFYHGDIGDVRVTSGYYKVTGFTPSGNAQFYVGGEYCLTNQYAIENGFCVPGYLGPGYGIDRWNNVTIVGGDGELLLESSGVRIINSNQWGFDFRQTIESPNKLSGKTVTVSALVKGNASSSVVRIIFNDGIERNRDYTINQNEVVLLHLSAIVGASPMSSTYVSLISAVDNTDFTVQAMKLELGDTQTLAHQENGMWVLNEIPNYREQLVQCQRYYLSDVGKVCPCYGFSGRLFLKITTPSPMRVNPTVTVKSVGYVLGISADLSSATSITTNAYNDGVLVFYDGTNPSEGEGTTDATISLDLDANL